MVAYVKIYYIAHPAAVQAISDILAGPVGVKYSIIGPLGMIADTIRVSSIYVSDDGRLIDATEADLQFILQLFEDIDGVDVTGAILDRVLEEVD